VDFFYFFCEFVYVFGLCVAGAVCVGGVEAVVVVFQEEEEFGGAE